MRAQALIIFKLSIYLNFNSLYCAIFHAPETLAT